MIDLEKTIDRIKKMEQLLDELQDINTNHPERIIEDIDVREKLYLLNDYIDSGLWMMDYECDERGELPPDLKRGVLSEDAIYDLLTDFM